MSQSAENSLSLSYQNIVQLQVKKVKHVETQENLSRLRHRQTQFINIHLVVVKKRYTFPYYLYLWTLISEHEIFFVLRI
jgi:hypothetical protein